MYKLSFEKCVCFILLVVLAFLSCSGFRIDSLATMNDISKRNSYTSTSLSPNPNSFLSRLIASSNSSLNNRIKRNPYDWLPSEQIFSGHRVRHRRNRSLRKRQHSHEAKASPIEPHKPPKPTGRVGRSSRHHNEKNRTAKPRTNNKNRLSNCQKQDVARKAYLANTVVRAKAESMSSNRSHNYSVTFRILEQYKFPFEIEKTLRLSFSGETDGMNCETEGHQRPHGLVKAKIQQLREYFLFVNITKGQPYAVVGMPVPVQKRARMANRSNKYLNTIRRVTNKNFGPSKPKITIIKERNPNGKTQLTCKAEGYPPPFLTWRRTDSRRNSRPLKIVYKTQRNATLIFNGEKKRTYECIATGVNNLIVRKTYHEREDGTSLYTDLPDRKPHSEQEDDMECEDGFKDHYCLNNGTCMKVKLKGEMACSCAEGFKGQRCEEKDISNSSSMYAGKSFDCKLGLSMSYYC